MDTAVLHLRTAEEHVVVKAHGAHNHHFERELKAHRHWLAPLRSRGAAARLRHSDEQARVLVTDYLPGTLVQGDPAENDPATYRQAGALLRHLHHQVERTDPKYHTRTLAATLRWLSTDHRIASATEQRLRDVLAEHPTGPARVVPTHGDYTPRNWLRQQDRICVIDFGRAAWRPAQTDFARLHARQFRRDREFEAEFLAGYGADPREPDSWRYLMVTEAIGVAVWAYQVGASSFEAEGHRMIAEALAGLGA